MNELGSTRDVVKSEAIRCWWLAYRLRIMDVVISNSVRELAVLLCFESAKAICFSLGTMSNP
jgi:hypothetical protein